MTVIDDQLELIDADDPTTIPRIKRELVELRLDVARLNTEVGDTQTRLREQQTRAEVAERSLQIVQENRQLSRENHQADIDLISQVLMEEAENRDWCDEYDRVIDRLNDRLNRPLQVRTREFVIDVRVSYETSFTVTARSQEEAEEILTEAETDNSWRVNSPFMSGDISQEGAYGHSVEVAVV